MNMVYLYDHEECGSQSAQGAESHLTLQNFKRIFDILAKEEKDVGSKTSEKRIFFIQKKKKKKRKKVYEMFRL